MYNNDNDLISLIQNGDMVAFRFLFEKYAPKLYQFSMKYLNKKEDSEDLVNDVFIKIWDNRSNLKTDTSFKSYLFTITYNEIRQRFLKKSREEKYVRLFVEKNITEIGETEEQIDYLLVVQKINHAIDLLPTRRREIFNLSYKEELKNQEIAQRLGLSEQFIKNQLSISRKFIIDKMKKENNLSHLLLFQLFFHLNFE